MNVLLAVIGLWLAVNIVCFAWMFFRPTRAIDHHEFREVRRLR
ncbi:hypothetical protein [Bradyrhizobium sp. JYMT SZCCT0428]|nr:hypothetical protein [Bradyrhizobium sp. JYMT SZCCT0428]